MSITGGADTLSFVSREFYENTKVKFVLSIALGGYCLLLLGWCCQAGGMNAYDANYLESKQMDNTNQNIIDAYNNAAAGYGFACFFYFCGFVCACAASVYISPVFSGTKIEKEMLSRPQEIDSISID
jgi:hypothetical protein